MYDIVKIKEKVIGLTVKGLVKYCEISREEALELVKESGIEKIVEQTPDLLLHFSKKQLVEKVFWLKLDKQWNIEELKKEIIKYAIECLMTRCNYTEEEAVALVQKSKIDESIERVPDLIAHYSEEQLLYHVLN